jgi:excisionase family DNA binding protein
MALITKADAARQLGISRTTLYKLIHDGKLSPTADGLLDTAELVRVLSTLNVHPERPRTPLNTAPLATQRQGNEHHERPALTSSERPEPLSSGRQRTSSLNTPEQQLTSSLNTMVDILREQLQAAQERERDYREHIAHLTTMLDQAHRQNQRLLDMPRTAMPPRRPQNAPGAAQAPTPPPEAPGARPTQQGDARGDMRRRIVALLQDHPEGLTPAEMRIMLGVERSLADTCLGMRRDGLVQRVGRGKYVAARPSHNDRP